MKAIIGEEKWIATLAEMGVTRATYKHLVKDKCAGCGGKIPIDIERYEQCGNHCPRCNEAVNEAIKRGGITNIEE